MVAVIVAFVALASGTAFVVFEKVQANRGKPVSVEEVGD